MGASIIIFYVDISFVFVQHSTTIWTHLQRCKSNQVYEMKILPFLIIIINSACLLPLRLWFTQFMMLFLISCIAMMDRKQRIHSHDVIHLCKWGKVSILIYFFTKWSSIGSLMLDSWIKEMNEMEFISIWILQRQETTRRFHCSFHQYKRWW